MSIATRGAPDVELEEVDGEDVVLRIRATPSEPSDGGPLAREVLATVNGLSNDDAVAA